MNPNVIDKSRSVITALYFHTKAIFERYEQGPLLFKTTRHLSQSQISLVSDFYYKPHSKSQWTN